ncbi:nuclear transport factor 2 family protein [Amycolatopsis sp. NPDC059027]|uniref:nuclear transport factor 2 family protein n=1 Tax=unclassified Amycolatopsis TaxID=2618356 RepID=UPI0036708BC8
MTPDEMASVFGSFIHAHRVRDIDGLVALFTEDAEYEVVGDPYGRRHGHESIRRRYEEAFEELGDACITVARQASGENLLFTESVMTAKAIGTIFGVEGGGRDVTYRVLHLCEFREGRISKQTVWVDASELMAQLLAPKE